MTKHGSVEGCLLLLVLLLLGTIQQDISSANATYSASTRNFIRTYPRRERRIVCNKRAVRGQLSPGLSMTVGLTACDKNETNRVIQCRPYCNVDEREMVIYPVLLHRCSDFTPNSVTFYNLGMGSNVPPASFEPFVDEWTRDKCDGQLFVSRIRIDDPVPENCPPRRYHYDISVSGNATACHDQEIQFYTYEHRPESEY